MNARDQLAVVIPAVGTSFKEGIIITAPEKFIIYRARAEIIDGSAIQVALSVRQRSVPLNIVDISLEYTLTNTPLDSEEYIFFKAQEFSSGNGVVYIAVKCNAGSGNIVRAVLDIEPVE